MKKFNYQTCLRMSDTLKNEMTKICDQNAINESDFMRHTIKRKGVFSLKSVISFFPLISRSLL